VQVRSATQKERARAHFDKFEKNSQKKFQRGHVFRNRLHRLADKVDGRTSKQTLIWIVDKVALNMGDISENVTR
jgi:hypothetical protein